MFQTDSAGAILPGPVLDKVAGKGSKSADDAGAFSQEFEKQVNKSSEPASEQERKALPAEQETVDTPEGRAGKVAASASEEAQEKPAEAASAEELTGKGGKDLPQPLAAEIDIDPAAKLAADGEADESGQVVESAPGVVSLTPLVENKDKAVADLLKGRDNDEDKHAPVALPLVAATQQTDVAVVDSDEAASEEGAIFSTERVRDVLAQRMLGGNAQGENAMAGRQGKMEMQNLIAMQLGQGRASQGNFDEALKLGATITSGAQSVPAQAPQASAASVPVTMTLALPVQQQGWDKAMAERVVWMARGNIQQAQIQLNPRDLGPIDIKISMQHDQTHVNFVAHHAATREAIEAAIPRLRDMFSEQGLNLGQADVSQHSFGDNRQAAAASGGHAQGSAGAAVTDEELIDETPLSQHISHVRAGGVDYFA